MIPAIGDWLTPRNPAELPGLVVAVLPSGSQCVIAARPAPTYQVVERAYRTDALKGPMTGRAAQALADLAGEG